MRNNRTRAIHTSTPAEITATILAKMQTVVGEAAPTFLNELAPMFLEDAPPLIAELREAVATGDPSRVTEAAGRLRGHSAGLAILALSARCQELEGMGLNGSLEGAWAKLSEVEAEYEQVQSVLRQYA